MPKLLGAVISADPNPAPDAMLFSTLWNFANGIAFAIIYAHILKALARQSTILTGFLLGLVMWLLSMSVALFLGAPLGWTLSIFALIDHLVYGVLVGLIYRHRERIGAS
jgi:F0F1-type ATP synthase membrane subunit c/vacuolar-type H+-ATPase subunit K